MQANATVDFPTSFSEAQRTALLHLLTDDDPAVYRTIREKIVSCGPSAVQWLQPHARSSDPWLRKRTREIISHFERQAADTLFLAFCLNQGKLFDLEEAALLLARTRYPEINSEGYSALLDSFAAEVHERLNPGATDREVLECLNRYFFQHLKFRPGIQERLNSENSYLNRVLDRRIGDPGSLCLAYMLIARRVRLPLTCIALPGYFVCRFQSTTSELYVDVFYGGRIMSKADCAQYLRTSDMSDSGGMAGPVTPRRFILRTCETLRHIYEQTGLTEESVRLKRYVVALLH